MRILLNTHTHTHEDAGPHADADNNVVHIIVGVRVCVFSAQHIQIHIVHTHADAAQSRFDSPHTRAHTRTHSDLLDTVPTGRCSPDVLLVVVCCCVVSLGGVLISLLCALRVCEHRTTGELMPLLD